MSSKEQNSPRQPNAGFLSGTVDDPEMNEMWQGFVAYYKRSKSAEQSKTVKVESTTPENPKQLTLDHWFGKRDKNAKNKPNSQKAVKANFQRSLQIENDTVSNNKSCTSPFEDIVPIESIPGPSTAPSSYTQAQPHPFGVVYDGAEQKYILRLRSPPNKIVRLAPTFHIVGPEVTSNSDLYGQILVDEEGVPIGDNSTESEIMYLGSSNEVPVAGHLNLSNTGRTSEEASCDDLGIIYQSCDSSFSEMNILGNVYVDRCGNLLSMNSVEAQVIDPNSFIPNATNVYSVTDQDYSEVISPDNSSKNVQNDTSHQFDLELKASLRKSSRKKIASDAKLNLTISQLGKKKEKDSDNSVMIVSPIQEMNGDSDELNTSPFLLEEKYRLVTENICAETQENSIHEKMSEVPSFDDNSCIEEEGSISVEGKDPSVHKEQTSTTFLDCLPKVFRNQLETNGTQNETTFVTKQSNVGFEVDKNKEFTSALNENIAFDFEFDDVCGLKEKSNESAVESSNSEKKSESVKRKFRKRSKNMPDYLSPSVSKKISQQRNRSISSEIQTTSDIFEGFDLPSDSTVENLDFDEISSDLFNTNSDKVSSNEKKMDSVKKNSKTLLVQKNRNSHNDEPCADLITDDVVHILKKDAKDSKLQDLLPSSYNLRRRKVLCLSPIIPSKRQKQAKTSPKTSISEETSNERQKSEISGKRSKSCDSPEKKSLETPRYISQRKRHSVSPQKRKENSKVPQLGSPTEIENQDHQSLSKSKQKMKSVSPKCASTEKPTITLKSCSVILNMLNSSVEKDELVPDENPKQQKKTKVKRGEKCNMEHDKNRCETFHSTLSEEAKCTCEETMTCSVCEESTLNGKLSVRDESLQDIENLDIIIEIQHQDSPEKIPDFSGTREESGILNTLQSKHSGRKDSPVKSPSPVNSKKVDKESKSDKKKPKRKNTKDSCVTDKNLNLRKKRGSTDRKQLNVENTQHNSSEKMRDISELAECDKESPDSSIEDMSDFQYKSHSENEDSHKRNLKISKSQNTRLQNKLNLKRHSSERKTSNTSIDELDLFDINNEAGPDSLDKEITNLVVSKHCKKQQTEKDTMCNRNEKDMKTKKRSPTQSGFSKGNGEPAEPMKKHIRMNSEECEPALDCNSNVKSGENEDITEMDILSSVSEKHVNKSNSVSPKTGQTELVAEEFCEKVQNIDISEKGDEDVSTSNQLHLSDSDANSLSTSTFPNQRVRRSKRKRTLSKRVLSKEEYETSTEVVKVVSSVILDQSDVKKKRKVRRLESDEEPTIELVPEKVPLVKAKQCTPPKLLNTSKSNEDSSDLSTRMEGSHTLDTSVSKQPKSETKKSKQSKTKQKSESDDDVRTGMGLKGLAKTSTFSKGKSKSPQERNCGKHNDDVIRGNSEERKIENNDSNLSCSNSYIGYNERDSSENVEQHIHFDPHDQIHADPKTVLENPNRIPSCETPKGIVHLSNSRNIHSNVPRKSSNDSIEETINFVCESNYPGEPSSPNKKKQSEVNANSKRKHVDDRKINAVKEKDDDTNSELFDSNNLLRKVSKREKNKKSRDVFKEKKDLSSEKSPLGHQKQSQLSPSSEQNRIQQSGSDCENNSFITSCNDNSKLGDDADEFEKFVEKEKKHFMKMVGSEKIVEFLKIVEENPNGRIVMVPSDNMINPGSGPGLILYKESFLPTVDSV